MVNTGSRINRRTALRGAGAVGAGSLLAWTHAGASAQDATPAAGGACGNDPRAGDAVSVIGPEGAETASITVTDVVDPFDAYDPNYAPQPGFRYVAVAIEAAVTGPRPVDVYGYFFVVQDAEGFVFRNASAQLAEDSAETLFADASLAPGTSGAGLLIFAVLRTASVARLFFQPDAERLILAADLRS